MACNYRAILVIEASKAPRMMGCLDPIAVGSAQATLQEASDRATELLPELIARARQLHPTYTLDVFLLLVCDAHAMPQTVAGVREALTACLTARRHPSTLGWVASVVTAKGSKVTPKDPKTTPPKHPKTTPPAERRGPRSKRRFGRRRFDS
jgi:hypothetical protein